MKKIYYALCFAAVSALSVSCDVQEKFGTDDLPQTAIAFSIGGAQTKASEPIEEEEQGAQIIQLFEQDGERFFLESTVTCLDDIYGEPVTKGTPAYSENVTTLYKSFSAVGFNATSTGNLSHNTPLLAEASYPYDKDKGLWIHNYTTPGEPWKADRMRFFMHMPETLNGVSNIVYTPATISFDYDASSLTTAESQQDILFATRAISKSDYKSSGIKLFFYHALTGVKFAVANPEEVVIKSVKFSGLYAKGKCTITPVTDGIWEGSASNAGGAESTKSSSKSVWTSCSTDTGYQPYQEFDGTADYSKSEYDFPNSFHGDDSHNTDKNNLNDNNASQTFWLIPQTLNANVKLIITYTYKGEEFVQTINFGELTKQGDNFIYWGAGELRTYTIKATAVGVTITDNVSNMTKNNIVITNTGNCTSYIRAAIIANWCDAEGNIVAPWTGSVTTGSDWVFNSKDGYYYYKNAVQPGSVTSQKLFDSYSYTSADKPSYGFDPVRTADHLVMDIAVQALKQGSYTSYTSAWTGEANVAF